MKDRIIQFLSENGLTSTKFADTIGVQRSSVSHILSGRNKPSFDFIEKMLVAYPELDAQWLITGKGNMYSNQPSLFDQEIRQENKQIETPLESNIQKSTNNYTQKSNSDEENELTQVKSVNHQNVSEMERIIIFYTNGSFKEYKPA